MLEQIELQPHQSKLSGASYEQRHDDLALARTGKKPVLKRQFGFMAILGFNCLIIDTWEGSMVLFGLGFKNGGPSGLFYGFILIWLGCMATFAVLAECASMAPTAGGQYHWVSLLAPRKTKKFLSFLTGWLTVTGWQAGIAGTCYICGQLIQTLIQVVNPSYDAKLWHGTLIFYGVLLMSIILNTVAGTTLPGLEILMLIIYIFGFVGIIVPLVYLAPHGTAESVFNQFLNEGGWSTQGLSFMVGLSGYAFAFLGSDSVYHLCEEVRDAAVVVPRTLLLGIFLDGVFGIGMLLAVLFCLGNVEDVLGSSYIFQFAEVLIQATQSIPGTAVIMAVLIIVYLGLCVSTMAAASRMLWAFSRDRGIPGWRWVSRVDRRTSIPVNSVVCTTIFSMLLGLISVGSPVAFNDVISLSLASLYISYFLACAFMLWRRLTGGIGPQIANPYRGGRTVRDGGDEATAAAAATSDADGNASSDYEQDVRVARAEEMCWGPWRMPEYFGIVVNVFACLYLLVILFFSFWPPDTPTAPDTMNYAVLVLGAVVIFSVSWYHLQAKRIYDGPVVEI